jgi:hypothetical protein
MKCTFIDVFSRCGAMNMVAATTLPTSDVVSGRRSNV